MKCGEEAYLKCPAYPEKGLDCWKVTGTRCAQGKMVKATIEEKLEFCRSCKFYIIYAHKF
jgi:hypothetical protein